MKLILNLEFICSKKFRWFPFSNSLYLMFYSGNYITLTEQYRIWAKSTYSATVSSSFLPFPTSSTHYNSSKHKNISHLPPPSVSTNTSPITSSSSRKNNSPLTKRSPQKTTKWQPLPPFPRKRKTAAPAKKPNASKCTANVSDKANSAQKTAIATAAAMTNLMSTRSKKQKKT